MGNLLKKELRLALHPTAPIFLLLSSMLMIPNYPYLVIFFYTGLAVFFTCLTGRENHDVVFTMLLPVAKKDVVKARVMLVALLEITQCLVAIPFAALRQTLIPEPNMVGMDANMALLAFALVQMGLFNLVFFHVYYRDVRRVGTAFVWSSVATFLYICIEEALTHMVPLFRDVLDTPDTAHFVEKLLALLLGVVLFSLMTWFACVRAQRDFELQDL